MRIFAARKLWTLATVAALSLAAHGAYAAQSEPPVDISSFSGAFLAARVAETDNDLDGAIAYYKKALAFDPDNQPLQQSLFLALLSQGRFDESLPYAEKLKTVADIERFSRLALAIDTFRRKDFTDTEFLLKFALPSDLDRLISEVLTAWGKQGAGDTKGALAQLAKVDGPDWYKPFTAFHAGLIAEASGDLKQAEASYKSLTDDLSTGGAAPETWLRAAEAHAGLLVRRGDEQGALAVLDKADEFSKGRLSIAQLREKIEKGEPVGKFAETASEGASEMLLDLATALNRGGGEPFVRLYLQFALALKPNSDVVLVQLASVAEQQQDAENAIELYRRVPADSPLKRLSELQLGLNLADLDRQDDAIKQLTGVLDQSPDDMRAYLALGGVYAAKEDYRSAAGVYDRAVARLDALNAPAGPDASANWNIYYQRGIAFERLKEWPKAEPSFKRALELYPDQPQVLNYLGYSWIDMNMNLEEGMAMIRKAVDLRPSDGYIVDSLGWAHFRLGQYDDAVRELERAVSLKPDDAVLNDHLGDAYWRVGRKLEAQFQWSHARDMKPAADILLQVQKKLADGLPPDEPRKAAEVPAIVPAPPEPVAPAEPEQRTQAAPAPAEPVVTAIPAAYTVQPGQSLWSIAVNQLGNGSRYIEIIDLNPAVQRNPARLVPGQELLLPASQ